MKMSKEERRKVYKEGYEQGRFDERMDSIDNRPPTEKEVCEALGEYLGAKVEYDRIQRTFVVSNGDGTWKTIDILYDLKDKPHLITLIGRFYEGKAHNE